MAHQKMRRLLLITAIWITSPGINLFVTEPASKLYCAKRTGSAFSRPPGNESPTSPPVRHHTCFTGLPTPATSLGQTLIPPFFPVRLPPDLRLSFGRRKLLLRRGTNKSTTHGCAVSAPPPCLLGQAIGTRRQMDFGDLAKQAKAILAHILSGFLMTPDPIYSISLPTATLPRWMQPAARGALLGLICVKEKKRNEEKKRKENACTFHCDCHLLLCYCMICLGFVFRSTTACCLLSPSGRHRFSTFFRFVFRHGTAVELAVDPVP